MIGRFFHQLVRKGFCAVVPAFLISVFAFSELRAQKNVELVNSGKILQEGYFYLSTGRYGKAESLYLKVGRNDTNYAEVLRDLARAYREDKEDSLCMLTCYKGLALNSYFEHDFYFLLGNSLKEMERYDTAIKTLDQGIRLYPYSYLMRYHKGMVYYKMKKYTEAQQYFQEAIMLNPRHADSHFQLGKLCAEQGRFVPAILSYQYYLMLEPLSERSRKVVSSLEDIFAGEYQPDPDLKVESKESGDDCFADIQEMINSQVALSPGYKNKTKINLKIVKQSQAMLEKMHFEPATGNWWMDFYVPYYVELQKKNYFVPFITFTLFPVADNSPSVTKSIKKNKKKIKEFATWTGKYINEHMKHPVRDLFSDKEDLDYIFFENSMVAGVGHTGPNDSPRGQWYYFYSKGGHLQCKGNFDELGKRTGEWTWYYPDGTLKEKATYENGMRQGVNEEFHPNGVLSFRCNYRDDVMEGSYELYGIHGALTAKGELKDGKLDGVATTFYTNGSKKADVAYKLGKTSGETVMYTFDGKVLRKLQSSNGQRNGHAQEYYSSGGLTSEGDYKNDEPIGAWKVFWSNGKVMREGVYKEKGLREGLWKEYYRDGTLHAETMFKAGKYSGEQKLYDIDGKLYCVKLYSTDKLKKLAYYDKSGGVIASYSLGKITTVTEYHPNGERAGEGEFEDGEKEGTWKVYSANGGWLTAKERYYNDYLSGPRTEFYISGKEKSELDYHFGERDGYLKSWHPNGTIESEGWFAYGEQQGDWYYYNQRGVVTAHRYFMNGVQYGYQEFFDNKGRRSEETYYNDEFMWTRTRFDSTGTVAYKYESENGTGRFVAKFPGSEKEWITQEYKNGYLEGPTARYSYNGTKVLETNYVNGEQHGRRQEFYAESGKPFIDMTFKYDNQEGASNAWYENGNKRWEENYLNGEYDGTQKYYHDNGQLYKENHWNVGTVNGETKYYAQDGSLQMVRYYRDGILLGYSYAGTDGTPVPMIALEDATGKFVAYYANGNKSLEGEFVNGRLHGHVVQYYPDGKLWEDENYEFGEFEGDQKYYFPNGNLRRESHYYTGVQDGISKHYFENGKLEHTEYYVLGDYFGEWKYYSEDGSLKKSRTYYNDQQLGETAAATPAPPTSLTPPAKNR